MVDKDILCSFIGPKLWRCLFVSFLFLVVSKVVVSQSIVKAVPGFTGDLPFKLETGYIGVGELDEVQLFYYFVESERSPRDDPLVLWLIGGPGCSGASALLYQIGPLTFNYDESAGNKPKLELNPYAWTKVANIIFLDSPAGSGFSYATTWRSYNVSDTILAAHNYEFLRKWLLEHPNFLPNEFYVAGDSYAGIYVPLVVQNIVAGTEAGDYPPINLQGYSLGNPLTNKSDINSRVEFAYMNGLISKKIYRSARKNCKGQYLDADSSNALCTRDLEVFQECTAKIELLHILEPTCANAPKGSILQQDTSSLIEEDSTNFLPSGIQLPRMWCRRNNYVYSLIWFKDQSVRKALHVREGTIKNWVRCNITLRQLSYIKDVSSSLDVHRNLIKKVRQVMIYSGDKDMGFPYVGTLRWIQSLNLTLENDWKPWFVDGQVAGYTMQYYDDFYYHLTFATIKGAGHTAAEYKPKECLAMVDRWFSNYPL